MRDDQQRDQPRVGGRADGESIDVISRIYHTVDGVPHAEGETYAVTDRVLAETLYGIGFVTIDGWTELAPPTAPVLSSLSPDTVALGAAAFTLSVQGSDFLATDVVHVNGAAAPTTFVSATELTTPIDPATLTEGVIPVSVQTADGQGSNALMFTVTAVRGGDAGRRDDGTRANYGR